MWNEVVARIMREPDARRACPICGKGELQIGGVDWPHVGHRRTLTCSVCKSWNFLELRSLA